MERRWKEVGGDGSLLLTHSFVIIDGDIECGLELSDHIRNAHSLKVYKIRDDEKCACVLIGLS